MENKQIVDDVQIRGCGHYWNGTCHAYTDNTGKFLLCVNNPHCYYKQLALKKQECEELRKQLERKEENYQKLLSKSNKYIHNLVDENVQDISNLAKQLDQLKAELEQEKALKETYFTCYKAKHGDIEGALFKLKQTLAEIKDLLLKTPTDSQKHCVNAKGVILLRIREVIPNEKLRNKYKHE